MGFIYLANVEFKVLAFPIKPFVEQILIIFSNWSLLIL